MGAPSGLLSTAPAHSSSPTMLEIPSGESPRNEECGSALAHEYGMSDDEKGATEAQMEKIDTIKGSEVLGYEGAGREEHSGENSPKKSNKLTDDLADNKPEQLPTKPASGNR